MERNARRVVEVVVVVVGVNCRSIITEALLSEPFLLDIHERVGGEKTGRGKREHWNTRQGIISPPFEMRNGRW